MFNGDEEWCLSLMVGNFLGYNNSKWVHSATKMIPREILFNFKKQKHCWARHCKYKKL